MSVMGRSVSRSSAIGALDAAREQVAVRRNVPYACLKERAKWASEMQLTCARR
jgi:hypothetical protein